MRLRLGQLVVWFAALAGCSTAHGAATPWRRVVLVELFTSQGCSSCPAADAFVRDLPELGLGRERVVPLTFHVDYWDGLGWKDRFARPELTARQEWYARSTKIRSLDGDVGLRGLYTPQMIIDGRVHLSGRRRQDAMREMERAGTRPPLLDLMKPEAAVHGSTLDVTVELVDRSNVRRDPDWRLFAALAVRRARTPVARGENAGETLDEAAVVRALSAPIPLPPAPGAKVSARLAKPEDVAWSDVDVVVFVQSTTSGAVEAAASAAPGRSRE